MKRLSPMGGVDIGGMTDPSTLLDLVRAHGLVIAHTELSRQGYADVCAALGSPVTPPFLEEAIPGSGVAVLETEVGPDEFDHSRHVIFASGWHSDWTFMRQPPTVSSLYCEVAPEAGGETLLCDSVPGHRHLSSPLRSLLGDLTAEHRSDRSFSPHTDYGRKQVIGAVRRTAAEDFTAVHPVLADSPLSGRPCLLISPAYVTRIIELTPLESDAILRLLQDAVLWAEHTVKVSWQPGMLVLWDNYRYVHRALNQGVLGRRVLLRANIVAR